MCYKNAQFPNETNGLIAILQNNRSFFTTWSSQKHNLISYIEHLECNVNVNNLWLSFSNYYNNAYLIMCEEIVRLCWCGSKITDEITLITAGIFRCWIHSTPMMWNTLWPNTHQRQTQLLVKWVTAAGMIAWIFKVKQLQTEASVTIMLVPRSVKQWQHVGQLQLPAEQLLNISAYAEGDAVGSWPKQIGDTGSKQKELECRKIQYVGWFKQWLLD